MPSKTKPDISSYPSIDVTQVLDFVWGNVDVALKLFPDALNFLIAPIGKKN